MITAYLDEFARACDTRLTALLLGRERRLAAMPVDLARFHRHLRDYVLRGGKRLRGALCTIAHEGFGGRPSDVLDAAMGLELTHAWLLAYDDVMDRDETRRGGPALHLAAAREAKDDHRGLSLTLVLGGLLQSYAAQCVASGIFPAERELRALRLLFDALEDTNLGQGLDVLAPLGPPLAAEGVQKIEQLKTGRYTFELPLAVGAVLAGASQSQVDGLQAYAGPLGEAFQLADDLQGAFADPAITGKPAGGDLREGKQTLLVALAWERALEKDRAVLAAGLGRRDLSDGDVAHLRAILESTGARTETQNRVRSRVDAAVAALGRTSLNKEAQIRLAGIADLVLARAA